MNIVLVETYSDILWIDFDQLAEGILQAPADRDRTPEGGIEIRELLAADGAGRVHAGSGFVYDYISQVGQFVADQLRNDFFRLAACRTVTNGDQIDTMAANQLFELFSGELAWCRAQRRGCNGFP